MSIKSNLILLLITIISFSATAQDDCATCDTLPNSAINASIRKLCFRTDSIHLEKEIKVEHQHICREYREIRFIKKTEKQPYFGFEIINNDTIYTSLDTLAQFPGGESAMLNFLMKNVKYPPGARDNGIQGTVYLTFIVNEEGKVNNIQVLRSPHRLLHKEAIRVINAMPQWESAIYKGRNVKYRCHLPIRFAVYH